MDNFETIINYLKPEYQKLFSDKDTGTELEGQITERDKQYTILLRDYIKITKARNTTKEIHKWLFFWLIVIGTILSIVFIYKTINRILGFEDPRMIVEAVPAIVTSLVTLVSTIIAVPLTIAKFLFNTDEDNNITNIITHTQEHDSQGIDILKHRFLFKGKNRDSDSFTLQGDSSDLPPKKKTN